MIQNEKQEDELSKDEFIRQAKRLGVVAMEACGELSRDTAWGILAEAEKLAIERGWQTTPAEIPKLRQSAHSN